MTILVPLCPGRCFDPAAICQLFALKAEVEEKTPEEVVHKLGEQRIIASAIPYATKYPRNALAR